MIRYPQNFTRQGYIDFLIPYFKNKFPYFTHPQIAIPIQEIVNNITELLLIPSAGTVNVDDYHRIRLLRRILAVKPEEFRTIHLFYLYSRLFEALNTLYRQPLIPIKDIYDDSLNNVALWLVREGESLDFLMVQKDNYVSFLQEMINHCVTEMAEVAEKNTPLEIKEQYKKSPLYIPRIEEDQTPEKTKVSKPEKEVSWNPQLETSREISSRKRSRESTREDFIGEQSKRRKQEDDEKEIQSIHANDDFIKIRYKAANGCEIQYCCGKNRPCERNEKKLGELYEKGSASITRNTFLARFWYKRAATHAIQQATNLLKDLPTPFYPPQHSPFWQSVPVPTTEGESSQSQEQIKDTKRNER